MSLDKINKQSIKKDIERVVIDNDLFKNYKLVAQNIHKMTHPTIITLYDSVFICELVNRWLLVRIEDYFKVQKLVIWLNKVNNKEPVNIDIESYFISILDEKNIKDKMIFKANSEDIVKIKLYNIFQFIANKSDDMLKSIIEGNDWLKTPFDWRIHK